MSSLKKYLKDHDWPGVPLVTVLLSAWAALSGCSGERAAPDVEEQWVGYEEVQKALVTGDSQDSDSIVYEFVFEYASSGPFEDDVIEALLVVYEDMEEGDTVCNLEWLSESDSSCRVVVHGSGLRAASVSSEHIYIGGLDIPTYDDGCTFAGLVEDTIWHADLRCEDGDSIRHLTRIDFKHQGLDGRLPDEAADSVSGSGDASEPFKLGEEGTFSCTMKIEDNGDADEEDDRDFFEVDFHDAEEEEHGWLFEYARDGTWVETIKVRNYPGSGEVATGTGTLAVGAHSNSSWTVWCRKGS